jgi:hypothetical protein
MELIWVRRETLYFYKQDWTGGITLILQENFFSSGIRACAEQEATSQLAYVSVMAGLVPAIHVLLMCC